MYQLMDVMSQTCERTPPGDEIEDPFPVDDSTQGWFRGPQGPVLDGVYLGKMGIVRVDNSDCMSLSAVAADVFTPEPRR